MAYASENYAGPKRRRRRPPVMGENAAEKARTPVVQAARETVDQIIGGLPSQQASKKLAALGLSAAEKRDVQGYSRARSQQATDTSFRKLTSRTGRLADELVGVATGVKPSEAAWSYTHPIERLTAPDQQSGPALAFFPFGRKAATITKPLTKPARADEIIDALPEAKKLRQKQEGLYREERVRRAGKAEAAAEIGGQEGYHAALGELKGELPKLKFGALENFDQQAADELFTHVQRHQDLRPYEKISTQTALKKVIGGQVPTRSEIRLLQRAFGPDVAEQIADSVPFWSKAKNLGLSVINVPRSLRSSFDLSAPFRQGLVLGARHPRMFAREFKPMLKSFASEGAYQDVMDNIASRATFPTMQKAKLQLTDLEGLSGREEGFMSNLAERIPGVGRGVRASGRGYTAFLNKFRADAFDNYLELAESQGLDIQDERLLKSIASWVNHATGRGSVKSLEGAMVPLNALLFSPRLIASRLQLLNPAYYAKLDPFARKQAVRGMSQLLGAVSLTLWLAKTSGDAEVGLDPRSADFGKIKVGDTRVDIAGGFQQYIVAATRLVKGETVSSVTGEVSKLEGGFAKPSRADIVFNFAENKLAPVPSFGIDWLKNENFAGDKFNPAREGGRMMLPLGAENAYEGFTVGGTGPGIASVGLGSIGFGVQTYGPDKPNPAPSPARRSSGGRYRSSRNGRYTGGPGRNYAGPRS